MLARQLHTGTQHMQVACVLVGLMMSHVLHTFKITILLS